jgi:hypothetical protein
MLVAALTRLTTAMAIAAPIVVFGFLYVLQVQPERAKAVEARGRLDEARAAVNRKRLFAAPPAVVNEISALDEFDARTAEGDRAAEVAGALAALLNSPAVGGVSSLSIETGAPSDGPIDSIVGLFSSKVTHTPVTVTFDARYEQIGRFFWNLRLLPTTFDLQSLEVEPGPSPRAALMHTKVSLLVFHRPEAAPLRSVTQPQTVDVITVPEWRRDPFATTPRPDAAQVSLAAAAGRPEPVVSSILFSSGRRVALVDGRIVRPGDRVRAAVVQSIEPDAVVIASPGGPARRLEIVRPVIRMARR